VLRVGGAAAVAEKQNFMAGRQLSRQDLSPLPEALAVVLDRGVLDPQTVL
jgi:hypothetical protein